MTPDLTERQKHMLAVLATDSGAEFAPVQVQKLFFLLDENLEAFFGQKYFTFEPYDYGPFDRVVYHELDHLARMGLINIRNVGNAAKRLYSLTPTGFADGSEALQDIPKPVQDYLAELSKWVRQLSFTQLVSAVYKAFPKMRENSIFQD